MSAKLQIENITKCFNKNNNKLIVLNEVSFDVNSRDFVCILGPSGSGKSTLLRHIAGFSSPDSGHVLLNGDKIKSPSPRAIMVFQDLNQLFPWMTVFQNIMFALKSCKIGSSPEEREEIAKKYLKLVKLIGFDNYYPHQLSGGMKQKAAIAKALSVNPEVLLMDEPFGSLDAQTRNNLQDMLLEIWENTGVTIVFITHDLYEAIKLSNRIIVLDKENGNIKAAINNTVKRPRVPTDIEFMGLWNKLYDMLQAVE